MKSWLLPFCLLLLPLFLLQSCGNKEASSTKSATVKNIEPVKINGRKEASVPVAAPKNTNGEKLAWNKMEDLEQLAKNSNKKVLIDMYTSWCGWCKVMDRQTFSDPEVMAYLNENFHVVKFNAEQRNPITYRGKTYNWVQGGRRGVNELAKEMLNGRLGYPSLVYLDQNLNPIAVSPGFKKPQQLLTELRKLESI